MNTSNNFFNSSIAFSVLILSIGIWVSSCNKNEGVSPQSKGNLQSSIDALPREALSAEEEKGLLFMREEEKLAKDVYTALYAKWNVAIFSNIAESEQSHTEAVGSLLAKYNLQDPATNSAIGIFNNQSLQKIYNQLIAKGSQSLLNALEVGATIEDIDIADLKKQLANVDNQDIKLVYDKLAMGSRNHLRSFYGKIVAEGGTFKPQYISQIEFDTIISSQMESGK